MKVQYASHGECITALFHLHSFLNHEKAVMVQTVEEDDKSGRD